MPTPVRKRYFTLAQANALLPKVRARLSRMMQLSAHLRAGGETGQVPTPPGTPWLADPVVAAWDAPDAEKASALTTGLYETLSQELRGLEALGVEVKDLTIGLVDFPTNGLSIPSYGEQVKRRLGSDGTLLESGPTTVDGYKVVLASPDGTADGAWRPRPTDDE